MSRFKKPVFTTRSVIIAVAAAAMLLISVLAFVVVEGTEETSEPTTIPLASNITDDELSGLLESYADDFARNIPEIRLEYEVRDNTTIRAALRSPDTLTANIYPAYSGREMMAHISAGRLQSLETVLQPETLEEQVYPVLVDPITSGETPYMVPNQWRYWGVWYNTELFEAAGITQPPSTIAELSAAVERLESAGIVPFSIGAAFGWPVEAWFDYLYVRNHGASNHRQLVSGELPFTHDSVRNTLETMAGFIRSDWFAPGSEDQNWLEALQDFEEGETAMYLMGDYLWDRLSSRARRRTDFFQFPGGAAEAGGEIVSVEGWVIPTQAPHAEYAHEYLEYLFFAGNIQSFSSTAGTLPVRRDAVPAFAPRRHSQILETIAESPYGFQLFSRQVPGRIQPSTGFATFFRSPTSDGIENLVGSLESRRTAGE